MPDNTRDFRTQLYGLPTYGDLFTARQLDALTTFSDLICEVRKKIEVDAQSGGTTRDKTALYEGGTGTMAYAEAVTVYLAFSLDKCSDYWCSATTWASTGEFIRNTFARQAIAMNWDFSECNVFSSSTGNWTNATDWVSNALLRLPATLEGRAIQQDATQFTANRPLISTDPPYYDNIGYVRLRRQLPSTARPFVRLCLHPAHEENRCAFRSINMSRPDD